MSDKPLSVRQYPELLKYRSEKLARRCYCYCKVAWLHLMLQGSLFRPYSYLDILIHKPYKKRQRKTFTNLTNVSLP